jgi:hypothetical protein
MDLLGIQKLYEKRVDRTFDDATRRLQMKMDSEKRQQKSKKENMDKFVRDYEEAVESNKWMKISRSAHDLKKALDAAGLGHLSDQVKVMASADMARAQKAGREKSSSDLARGLMDLAGEL